MNGTGCVADDSGGPTLELQRARKRTAMLLRTTPVRQRRNRCKRRMDGMWRLGRRG
jgi:hypothetical protein